MKKLLDRLISIKSIVTLELAGVFAYLVITGLVSDYILSQQ